jgi:hypothetical protein
MVYHVDILENDWSGGRTLLRVRVSLNGAGIELTDTSDADTWRAKLPHVLINQLGEEVHPEKDPKEFLNLLGQELAHGTYMFALGPHADVECPIPPAGVVSMRELPVPDQPRL